MLGFFPYLTICYLLKFLLGLYWRIWREKKPREAKKKISSDRLISLDFHLALNFCKKLVLKLIENLKPSKNMVHVFFEYSCSYTLETSNMKCNWKVNYCRSFTARVWNCFLSCFTFKSRQDRLLCATEIPINASFYVSCSRKDPTVINNTVQFIVQGAVNIVLIFF
jgi:hypothetical protein